MAKGRFIIKEISYDERIDGLSDMASGLFPYCLPHLESDGSLPRSAHSIRLMCFPGRKVTDSDVESAILEWLVAKSAKKPAICQERGGRLFFTDFEECNAGLSFLKMRKAREESQKLKKSQSSQKVTSVTKSIKAHKSLEVEVEVEAEAEVEVKKQLHIVPTPQEITDYAKSIGFQLDGQQFHDYYQARGWALKGNVKMKDWRAAVRTWRRNDTGGQGGKPRIAENLIDRRP